MHANTNFKVGVKLTKRIAQRQILKQKSDHLCQELQRVKLSLFLKAIYKYFLCGRIYFEGDFDDFLAYCAPPVSLSPVGVYK